MDILPVNFYLNDTVTVAKKLLGKFLVKKSKGELLIGKITETEAYLQDDPASHSFNGQTKRTTPMFMTGGISYVYFIYGMYDCFNVVTEREGYGGAVLIRALEPVAGVEQMWRNRFINKPYPDSLTLKQTISIANGPGKLAQSMKITTKHDNMKSLQESDLMIKDKGLNPNILSDYRIGISKATDKKWRFFIKDNPYVSKVKFS